MNDLMFTVVSGCAGFGLLVTVSDDLIEILVRCWLENDDG